MRFAWIVAVIAVIAMLSGSIAPGSVEAAAQKRVAILLFSEEPRYAHGRQGFIDQLNQEGFKEPAVSFFTENARGSKAKAAELAESIASGKPDLVFTLGTLATVPVARLIKHAPIVFSSVYDPVGAEIAQGWKTSGNNTTGCSPMVPMSDIVKTLNGLRPVRRLAVLYTPGERNSELPLLQLQKLPTSYGIKVIPVIVTGKEDVTRIMPEIVRAADAIYITGSIVLGASVKTIVATANRANVITVTHLDDLVDKGVLVGVCADSYRLGRLAGKKAALILRGAKPAALPIEMDRNPDVIVNRTSARTGRFSIPASFMNKVTRFVE